MARRKESLPLQKITLNVYEGEFARLGELHPKLGPSKVVRELIHGHIKKIEARSTQPLTTIPTEIDDV